jgi:tetratricopeptide repeat protein 21B
LELCIELIELSKKLSPRRGHYYTIHGNLLLQAKRYKTAQDVFNKAIEIVNADSESLINDSNDNVPANKGLVKALIMQGKLDDAVQYISFLNDISDSFETSLDDDDIAASKPVISDLKYLNALIQEKMGNVEDCFDYLDEAVKAHDEEMKKLHSGLEFFNRFNTAMLLDIADTYQRFGPSEPLSPTDPPSQPLQQSISVLERLLKTVPASLPVQLLYAKARYLSRDFDSAQAVVDECLSKDQKLVKAHIIAAEISYSQENYTEASNALERAISSNFQIRDWPIFNLLRARVSAATGDTKSALDVLQRALKSIESPTNKQKMSPQDIVSVYLELANVYTKLSQEVCYFLLC